MTGENFQKTGLWLSSLAEKPLQPFEEERTRLRAALLSCRANIKPIVGRIAQVLPGLTVHDISHLDALWETADLIAGTGYPMNPLEGYVFGLSVLLHDAAMCWEAYEHGRDGVRATIEWKDAYAHECDISPDTADDERRSVADFAALRALHAHQASKLLEASWRHPDTNQDIYLVDDAQLRIELGPLAGMIASSHHWDIDALSARLGEQVNAPSPFPTEWSFDPVKIACLLRCADAAHINQSRAPLFLYSLMKRNGVSLEHWRAQTRMMGPSLDAGDSTESTITYTASRAFRESDATAWWIAHDAVLTVSQEIQSSNELLEARSRRFSPEFRVKRVKGADCVDELAKYLRVDGWTPCKARPHVSNVESLVKELGGEKLYGVSSPTDTLTVVLRELIQNARDAVVARRFIESDFDGDILVRLIEKNQEQWLCVEDNGIGMSHRVITGPLLDFGNSFWKSSLVKDEFPGLRSSQFRSIGRFGIGFYSVFMAGDFVEVASRVWDRGMDESNVLVFANGVSLRPILRHGRPENFSSQTSTRVSVRLRPGLISNNDELPIKPNTLGADEIKCSITEFISALVIGLDVRVSVITSESPRTEVHSGKPGDQNITKEILSSISFVDKRCEKSASAYIENNHHRLRPIMMDGHILGVAAIATDPNNRTMLLGLHTVGGLPTSLQAGHSDSFIGYIDYKPRSARRDITVGFEAPVEVIREWARHQLEILEEKPASELERCIAGAHAASFNCDPIDFARIILAINGARLFMTYQQLAELAESQPVGIFKSCAMDHAETYHSINAVDGVALIIPVVNGNALNLKMIDDKPEQPNSIIGCLHRAIVANGRVPKWQLDPTHFESRFFGSMSLLVVRSHEA